MTVMDERCRHSSGAVAYLAVGLVLAVVGVWLSALSETVMWSGPHGGGSYQRPAALWHDLGAGALGAATVLLGLGAVQLLRTRRSPAHQAHAGGAVDARS